jgi:hypothetical protein
MDIVRNAMKNIKFNNVAIIKQIHISHQINANATKIIYSNAQCTRLLTFKVKTQNILRFPYLLEGTNELLRPPFPRPPPLPSLLPPPPDAPNPLPVDILIFLDADVCLYEFVLFCL